LRRLAYRIHNLVLMLVYLKGLNSNISKHRDRFKNNQYQQENYIEKLIELDECLPLDNTFFSVIEFQTGEYIYISKNFEICTFLKKEKMYASGENYFLSRIHPTDKDLWLDAKKDMEEIAAMKIQTYSEKKNVNYTYNYRIKNGTGTYINIIQNINTIELDKQNNERLGLFSFTIVAPTIQMDVCASLRHLDHENNYKTLFFKNYATQNFVKKISSREKDILRLLILRKTSKEIGEKLYISYNTVNTHRRNILKKLNIASTGELLSHLSPKQIADI